MNFQALTLAATAVIVLSGFSVWSNFSNIDKQKVLSDMQGHGFYEPEERGFSVPLPDSDPRAQIPQALLDQLSPLSFEEKGEV